MRHRFPFAELQEVNRENDRDEAFEDIENETDDTRPFTKGAKDVGRADVSRAMFSDINSFEDLADNEAKGSGCHQKGDDGKNVRHGGRISN